MYDRIRSDLWNENGARDGVSYETALLEQYKLYVEMTDRVGQRRAIANTFFLSINTLVAVVVGGLWAEQPDAPTWYLVFPLVILVGMCAAWFWIVRSYRQLASVKWKVVGALEERLPASPWRKAEWAAVGEGKDRSRYWPLTRLEQWVPLLFGATYIGAFVAALIA